jgi:hypothetical protein
MQDNICLNLNLYSLKKNVFFFFFPFMLLVLWYFNIKKPIDLINIHQQKKARLIYSNEIDDGSASKHRYFVRSFFISHYKRQNKANIYLVYK